MPLGACLVFLITSPTKRRTFSMKVLGWALVRTLHAISITVPLYSCIGYRYVIDTGIETENPEFQGRTYLHF